MLSIIKTFFAGSSTYLWLALIVSVTVGGLSTGVYHYHKIYQEEVTNNAVLKENIVTLNDKIVSLNNQIKADGELVKKYEADSKLRDENAKNALAFADNKFREYQKKAQALLAAAATSPDMCISANFLYNDFILGGELK